VLNEFEQCYGLLIAEENTKYRRIFMNIIFETGVKNSKSLIKIVNKFSQNDVPPKEP
jgi:hypothetical protein